MSRGLPAGAAREPSSGIRRRTVRELSLSYGIIARQVDIPQSTDALVKASVKKLMEKGFFGMDDTIAFIGGGQIYSAHTNFLQVDTPATLLK